MEKPLLNEPGIFPVEEVLKELLGGSYPVYAELMNIIAEPAWGLVPEWHYYKDGKAWLCKVVHKKKTIFWLSVWDKYFKTTFYFTEKNSPGISGLDIDEELKGNFTQSKHIGKLIPLTVKVNRKEQLQDVLRIVEYKKNLK